MNTSFKAFQVVLHNKKTTGEVVTLSTTNLPDNDLIIKVSYSSLNFKDALSASGNKGVTQKFPHVPGIDAVGTVVSSKSDTFVKGDNVLVTGFDLGMNTWGGYGEYISVPQEWALPLPTHMTEKEAMIYGTAGLTAGLSIYQLHQHGVVLDSNASIAISGASGGVGSIATGILSNLGCKITAITNKPDTKFFKDTLGADTLISREDFVAQYDQKAMASTHFTAGVDTVSGSILSGMLKATKYGGAVSCCGMVASATVDTSIFPFILRGVSLIGIDSVQCPLATRKKVWELLSDSWKPKNLSAIAREITLAELDTELKLMLTGKSKGRVLLKHNE